ncbi:MAG: hypothetical protein A2V53_00100 [Deltaproteobacteria bacterium RBG_19FT_COMBO_56_10]|nr:MAG: hypothetical protein A2V53_00100 [Deltaproteobacteria bacterium RBG_19FT_COMBO_56_10]
MAKKDNIIVGLDIGTTKICAIVGEKTRDGVLKGIEAFDLNNHREVIVRFTTDVVKEGGKGDGKKG